MTRAPSPPRWTAPPLPGPIRVAVVADPGGFGVNPIVRAEIEQAAGILADAGYAVEEADVPRLTDGLTSYLKMITSEFGLTWPRLRTLLTEESARHMELNLKQQPPLDLADYLQLTADRHAIIRDWLLFLSDYPLVLGPVSTEPPGDPSGRELNAEENVRIAMAGRLCTVTTFVGLPAVALPTRVDNGVPLGVQIIGRPFREDLCLSAAAVIEAAAGTFTPVS
ncbi:hypothetical protein GCM10020216_017020 [Nonomuraea helvata]